MADWYVYILRCGDGTLYTGITTDVERRLEEHQAQGSKSARYVRGRAPLKLVYARKRGTRSEAAREEWRIKQLSRADKERLIRD
ncbi:MAG: GIY-YIG nuclease family protein [Puniceicoccaceae bacterium]